ncbi:hypothetical protein AB0383_20420 [Amycolatopsis sp. NPDC051373]|uniref:hypothetical protein n=1 Tax=Amycolatopsis sp. NPDC051373 TaxID=3155801 RepID=UPI00344D9681
MAQSDDNGRLEQRDWDMWNAYVRGATQQQLAMKYKITHSAVSQRLKKIRESIPLEEKQQVVRRHLDALATMSTELWQLVDSDPVPAYSNGKRVTAIDDDGTETPVWDHSGRLAAMDRLRTFMEREAKLVGLDAAIEANLNVEDRRPRELLNLIDAKRAEVAAREAELRGGSDGVEA